MGSINEQANFVGAVGYPRAADLYRRDIGDRRLILDGRAVLTSRHGRCRDGWARLVRDRLRNVQARPAMHSREL